MRLKYLLCKLFGHKWIMLGWYHTKHETPSTVTGWRCDRCQAQKTEQWDLGATHE